MVYAADINDKTYSGRVIGSRSGSASVTLNSRGEFFPAGSLDGVFLSNITADIINATEGSPFQAINKFIRGIAHGLNISARFVFRNPIAPENPFEYIERGFRTDDGKSSSGDPEKLSTAALFELYWEIKRNLEPRVLGYPIPLVTRLEQSPGSKYQKYRLPKILADEFMIVLPYVKDIKREARRCLPVDRDEFEVLARSMGIRMLYSRPETNPWVVDEVWSKRTDLADDSEGTQHIPTNNYVYVGERVGSDQGVEILPVSTRRIKRPSFLSISSWKRIREERDRTDNKLDVVERPRQTIDIVPWFELEGRTFVVGKDYPRRLLL